MRLKIGRVLLVCAITLCIVVVAYSVAVTAEVGQRAAYALAAVGTGILALLVLVGVIDADRADDGVVTTILSLLPRTLKHADTSPVRAVVVSLGLGGIAALSYWAGPAGLGTLVVACGEAEKVQPVTDAVPADCKASYAERYWRAPWQRAERPALVCYDAALISWPGTWSAPGRGTCGARPLEARFAQVGIPFPDALDTGATSVHDRDRAAFDRLAAGLQKDIPELRRMDDTLLFATWNMRWLGRANRLDISYVHMSQIISHFDVVAFQELQSQDGLDRILRYLGPAWRAEYGLESPGPQGNRERLGFLYDSSKVQVDPVSSNMVLASSDLRHTETGQPARPPFVAAFSVNGRKVLVANTHIIFGRPDARADRISELEVIAQNLGNHAKRSFGGIPALLVGDINAETPDGPVIAAVEEAGFYTDAALRSAPSSVFTDKVYDQIFVQNDPAKRLVFGQTGTFNPFDHVMRREDMPLFQTDLARATTLTQSEDRNRNLYLRWRSSQLSDHKVKWAAFRMDW
ncbi:endonuclease/exonuclease/phosphatase family protein [uncultured Tateyamaria sp.]|uniref:endonuclease/exonuclease/phosphatase family protein n=1 Tax=uncultured Tateyamaria sp. TaxID=455651 RepID=UPI002615D626|nr:endonuclease/exonuclease/phosphatase family protein [uncultured Tateyamaria sp.]